MRVWITLNNMETWGWYIENLRVLCKKKRETDVCKIRQFSERRKSASRIPQNTTQFTKVAGRGNLKKENLFSQICHVINYSCLTCHINGFQLVAFPARARPCAARTRFFKLTFIQNGALRPPPLLRSRPPPQKKLIIFTCPGFEHVPARLMGSPEFFYLFPRLELGIPAAQCP